MSEKRSKTALRNMNLVVMESAATAALLATPIMTPFYIGLGLSQEEIALSQMAFTVVVVVLNMPLGWVADRFSRKWANVFGDLLVALALFLYSMANSFWYIVFCEVLCGVGSALSQGVDSTLLKHFAAKVDDSGHLFRKKFAKMASWKQISTLFILLLGGPIGAISFRLAIALSAAPMVIGAFIGLLIEDDSEKLEATSRNPIKEMDGLLRRNIGNSKFRTSVAAYAVGREITHGIIWCFTPLLLYVGVPLAVVSAGWAINYIAAYFGTRLARRFARKMRDWQIFVVPIGLVTLASTAMFIQLTPFTIGLYLLFGLAQGWSSATLMPMVKEHVRASEQSSMESFAHVVAEILYIGAVWVINRAADVELRYALLATVLIFVPLAIPIAISLRKKN